MQDDAYRETIKPNGGILLQEKSVTEIERDLGVMLTVLGIYVNGTWYV